MKSKGLCKLKLFSLHRLMIAKTLIFNDQFPRCARDDKGCGGIYRGAAKLCISTQLRAPRRRRQVRKAVIAILHSIQNLTTNKLNSIILTLRKQFTLPFLMKKK